MLLVNAKLQGGTQDSRGAGRGSDPRAGWLPVSDSPMEIHLLQVTWKRIHLWYLKPSAPDQTNPSGSVSPSLQPKPEHPPKQATLGAAPHHASQGWGYARVRGLNTCPPKSKQRGAVSRGSLWRQARRRCWGRRLHLTPLHRPGCSACSSLNSWVPLTALPGAAHAQGEGCWLLRPHQTACF